MKILLTGGAGYIGSIVVDNLQEGNNEGMLNVKC